MSTTNRKLGPSTRAASWSNSRDRKKRKVLVAIAAYADAGRPDPSIREIVATTKLPRYMVLTIVDTLEKEQYVKLLKVRQSAWFASAVQLLAMPCIAVSA